MRFVPLLAALLVAAPVAAQTIEWRAAREYEVLLLPDGFEPSPIRLASGQPVRLRFLSQGQGDFTFSAADFFRSAQIRPGDAELIDHGRIEVPAGESVVIALVPAPGRYRARSANPLRRLLGTRVEIIVE